jgi:DDE superfamily endonuclease
MTVAQPHRTEEEPAMPLSHLPELLSRAFCRLASCLDRRSAPYLTLVLAGILFASGRRTATSWLRAAGISTEFRSAYNALGAAGRRTSAMASAVLSSVEPLLPEGRLLFALDDTPTPRYGPHVEGAGRHRNPTPGPAGEKFIYGHLWVTLAWAGQHPDWGCRALPLRSQLYVREKDLERVPPDRRPAFRTKLQLGAELLRWLKGWLGHRPGPLWLVVDGGYAKKPFLRPAREQGFVVVSRLRKDAALWTVPDGQRRPGQPGPLPTYGKGRISLAKRAGQTRGWQQVECVQYRRRVTKTVKTFLATWKPAGGLIRVVLVREEDGWLPLFCTDPQASVADILEAAADRNALEETNKDVKELWGAGQQQLRNVDANVGAFNLNGWMYTLVEAWAWDKPEEQLVDRSDSPWDQEDRRPSHADKRKALQREVLRREIQEALSGPLNRERIQALAEQLLSLAG